MPPSKQQEIISIEHLSHRFSDQGVGLDDVTLTICSGEFVILAGPNGSGKSTLLKHLNGILSPSEGTILLKGRPVSEDLQRARRLVGMVFQDADSQIVGETVWEDTAFGPQNLSFKKSIIQEKVQTALETVGIAHLAEKPPYLLSGGEKRRLAIAGVLAMGPQIIAFDEPFSNLDFPGTCQVLEQMIRLQQNGHTLIVATHELDRVYHLADRLIIMQNGKLVKDGTPKVILADADGFGLKLPFMETSAPEKCPWQP
ncbi:MAG: ABC transporter ATP-binding protein [Deltaproteobacteria bacterium]|nr:ABC transporter ATP-binding protein [Deltaproteobacteria bacterium]